MNLTHDSRSKSYRKKITKNNLPSFNKLIAAGMIASYAWINMHNNNN